MEQRNTSSDGEYFPDDRYRGTDFEEASVLIQVFLISTTILILVLNIPVVFMVLVGKCFFKKRIRHVHILSLSISDLLTGIAIIPVALTFTMENGHLSYYSCFARLCFLVTSWTASVYHVGFICLDRIFILYSYCIRQSAQRDQVRFVSIVALTWILAVITIVLPFIQHRHESVLPHCALNALFEDHGKYLMKIWSILFLFGVVTISGVCLFMIRLILLNKNNQVQPSSTSKPTDLVGKDISSARNRVLPNQNKSDATINIKQNSDDTETDESRSGPNTPQDLIREQSQTSSSNNSESEKHTNIKARIEDDFTNEESSSSRSDAESIVADFQKKYPFERENGKQACDNGILSENCNGNESPKNSAHRINYTVSPMIVQREEHGTQNDTKSLEHGHSGARSSEEQAGVQYNHQISNPDVILESVSVTGSSVGIEKETYTRKYHTLGRNKGMRTGKDCDFQDGEENVKTLKCISSPIKYETNTRNKELNKYGTSLENHGKNRKAWVTDWLKNYDNNPNNRVRKTHQGRNHKLRKSKSIEGLRSRNILIYNNEPLPGPSNNYSFHKPNHRLKQKSSIAIENKSMIQKQSERKPPTPKEISTSSKNHDKKQYNSVSNTSHGVHKRAVLTISILSCLFVLCNTPFMMVVFMEGWNKHFYVSRQTRHAVVYLACLNAACNPIIYALRIKEVRVSIGIMRNTIQSYFM